MKCPFCEREIKPEITNQLESWGIIKISKCPRCIMIIKTELDGFNKVKRFRHIKEILKELKLI